MEMEYVAMEMADCIDHFKNLLSGVRTGRASTSMMEHIKVSAYGAVVPLKEIALLTAPEFNQIIITPFDKSIAKEVFGSLNSLDLDMSFILEDGPRIRVTFPAVTEDYKKNIIKRLRKDLEEHKVTIRRIRMQVGKEIKEEKSNALITEDELSRLQKEIDEETSKNVNLLNEIFENKSKDILQR